MLTWIALTLVPSGLFYSAATFDHEQLILATAWVGVYKAESPNPSELVDVVDLCVYSCI